MTSPDDKMAVGDQPSPQTKPVDKKTAKGRTLCDVQGDSEFSEAEIELLKACAGGTAAKIAAAVPTAPSKENVVRASLIRFIALGGDDSAPVHERGLSIVGAWIDGTIDLTGCEVSCPLSITNCNIAGDLLLVDGKISNLNLGGTTLTHIDGDRLTCSGSILLRRNFRANGIVRFSRASIKGDLELMGATLNGRGRKRSEYKVALLCVGIEVGGSVFASGAEQPFRADGIVSFYGAKIGGDFSFKKAKFNSNKTTGLSCDLAEVGGPADPKDSEITATRLNCDLAEIRGSVDLEGSEITGRLELIAIQINSDLNLTKCKFERNSEIFLTRADVKGRFIFRELTGSIQRIVLRGARTDVLIDDIKSWCIADNLILDGFRYERILDIGYVGYSRGGEYIYAASPIDAKSRIQWLKMQDQPDLEKDFKPQPWEQLSRVLAIMGHEEDARLVAIEKQRQKRSAWLIQSRVNKDGLAKRLRLLWSVAWHWIYGILSRYGYRPSLLIGWAFLIALFFAAAFGLAERSGAMAPTDRTIFGSSSYDHCRPNNWTRCAELLGKYPPFDPIIYSFDLILPVIATQHLREWAPLTTKADGRTWRLGLFVWILSRIENLVGWVLGLMFVATVAGLVKKD